MHRLPEDYTVSHSKEGELGGVKNIDVHKHIANMLEERARGEEEHGDENARKVLSYASTVLRRNHPASAISECA